MAQEELREWADMSQGKDLKDSDLRFRTMFEQSPLSTQIFSPDGYCLRANRAWQKLWEASVEDLAGYDILADQQLAAKGMMPYIERAFAGESVVAPPVLYDPAKIGRPGRPRWVEALLYPVKDEAGAICEIVLVLTDITERKNAEQALRESEERIRFALDAANMGTWDWSVESDAVRWSGNVEAIHGLQPGSFAGTFEAYLSDVHPEDRQSVTQALRRSLDQGIEHNIEYRIIRPDGSIRWVMGRGKAILDEGGNPSRMSGICMDVTERKLIEQRLREEREAIETLNRIERTLSAELDIEKLVQNVTDAATELAGAQFGAFFYNVTDESGESYLLYTVSGVPRESLSHLPLPRNTHLFGPTFRGEQVIRCDDVTKDPRYGKNPPHYGMPEGHLPVKSYLAVPVISRSGEVMGGLFLGHSTPGLFTEREELIVTGLAAQTAIAMDNARLFDMVRRERALAEQSEQHYRFLAESIPQIVWTARPDGYLDYYNHRWYEYTGLTLEQSAGWGWQPVLHPDDLQMCIDRWMRAVETGESYEVEYRFKRTDGQYRWHLGRALPLCDPDGRIVKWFGTCTDIDDQKRAQEERAQLLASEQRARREAEAANRAKDEFLATVSHELRTPLNAVLGWARMLGAGNLDQGEVSRAVETIERNARAQAQLIEDILDVSRIITGKLRLDMRPVDLMSVIDAAILSVRPAAEAKQIDLRTVFDPFAGSVSGDPDRLQQVVWNLLSNAIKFTPRGGRVEVCLERSDSHVEIRVSDTGRGISADFLPHVFDRFRQEDSTMTRAHGGLGLGLAIVRHLAEMHGGAVQANSRGEGCGAIFTVKLPLRDGLASGKTSPAARYRRSLTGDSATAFDHGSALAGLRVLVLDDDPDARALLAAILSQCSAEVNICASAAEAYAEVERWKPDVLVSDIEMPDEDGYTFMRKLRALPAEKGGRVPAVALTAHARPEDRVRALSAGYLMHISKPVEPAELAVVIASLTGRTSGGD